MKRLLVLVAVLAFTAFADDISGTWKASIETPNGQMESTFVLKADGGKLTGSVTMGQMGDSAISEGKVDGDSVTFAVVREGPNGEFRLNYKGKVAGDEIKFTISMPARDRTFEMTAKKSK